MSKKNSSVILKRGFKDFEDLSQVYLNFKTKLDKLKKKIFLIAISGGPDSLALAALSKAYKYERKVKFNYVLVDHNIRKNSNVESKQVKNLLKKHNFSLTILKNKTSIKRNIQSKAREIRYDLITKYCRKKKIGIILTAHNLEDQVETFFIRLSRGSGLTGLSAMKPLSKLNDKIQLYRPLIETKKKYLIKISKSIFGKYFKDPSNKDKKYLRTKIRYLKKPLSDSGINYDQIIKSIKNLASSRETLEIYYKKLFQESVKIRKKEVVIKHKYFNQLNNEIKIKIINDSIKLLKKNYYNPRSIKVLNLVNNIKNNQFKQSSLGGCIFFVKKDNLCVKAEKY